MARYKNTCPMQRAQIIDDYFMEHRSKLIDIAAFLDRIERAKDPVEQAEDYRISALQNAIGLLIDGQPARAQRILESLSDPTTEPAPTASTQAAAGAYPHHPTHGIDPPQPSTPQD